jgi:ABC-2 type transport system permease protein
MQLASPGSLPWLVRHEVRMSARAMSASKARTAFRIAILVVWAGFGLVAAFLLRHIPIVFDGRALVAASAAMAVFLTLMTTQAALAAQRTLYGSGDLDLLLSAPIPTERVVAAKLLGIAASVVLAYSFLLLPIAVPIAIVGHPRLLALLPSLAALALIASSLGLGLSLALVKLLGARRARAIGQIAAAAMGGAIFLLSQVGGRSAGRIAFVGRWMERTGWGLEGWSSWPGRGALGEPLPLAATFALALGIFSGTAFLFRLLFLRSRQQAGEKGRRSGAARTDARGLFQASLTRAVVAKEVRLLLREPEILFSVTLRLIYLAPLALATLRKGGSPALLTATLAAVLAVAMGQLAGSLAGLTISAEDVPDLLAVSPSDRNALRRMKLLAALLVVSPLALLLCLALTARSLPAGAIALAGALAAGYAAGSIELAFGKPVARSTFTKRRGGSLMVSLLGVLAALGIGGVTFVLAWTVS